MTHPMFISNMPPFRATYSKLLKAKRTAENRAKLYDMESHMVLADCKKFRMRREQQEQQALVVVKVKTGNHLQIYKRLLRQPRTDETRQELFLMEKHMCKKNCVYLRNKRVRLEKYSDLMSDPYTNYDALYSLEKEMGNHGLDLRSDREHIYTRSLSSWTSSLLDLDEHFCKITDDAVSQHLDLGDNTEPLPEVDESPVIEDKDVPIPPWVEADLNSSAWSEDLLFAIDLYTSFDELEFALEAAMEEARAIAILSRYLRHTAEGIAMDYEPYERLLRGTQL